MFVDIGATGGAEYYGSREGVALGRGWGHGLGRADGDADSRGFGSADQSYRPYKFDLDFLKASWYDVV